MAITVDGASADWANTIVTEMKKTVDTIDYGTTTESAQTITGVVNNVSAAYDSYSFTVPQRAKEFRVADGIDIVAATNTGVTDVGVDSAITVAGGQGSGMTVYFAGSANTVSDIQFASLGDSQYREGDTITIPNASMEGAEDVTFTLGRNRS